MSMVARKSSAATWEYDSENGARRA